MAVEQAAIEGDPNSEGGGGLSDGIYNVLVNGVPIVTEGGGAGADYCCGICFPPIPNPAHCLPLPVEGSFKVFAGVNTQNEFAGGVHRDGDARACGATTEAGGGTNPEDRPVLIG